MRLRGPIKYVVQLIYEVFTEIFFFKHVKLVTL